MVKKNGSFTDFLYDKITDCISYEESKIFAFEEKTRIKNYFLSCFGVKNLYVWFDIKRTIWDESKEREHVIRLGKKRIFPKKAENIISWKNTLSYWTRSSCDKNHQIAKNIRSYYNIVGAAVFVRPYNYVALVFQRKSKDFDSWKPRFKVTLRVTR